LSGLPSFPIGTLEGVVVVAVVAEAIMLEFFSLWKGFLYYCYYVFKSLILRVRKCKCQYKRKRKKRKKVLARMSKYRLTFLISPERFWLEENSCVQKWKSSSFLRIYFRWPCYWSA
jgi:hypothetical protein